MPISKCLHPVRVKMHDNSFRYVPCGKCEACRSLQSYVWKKRLDAEMTTNVYTLAFTLTYDDFNLPFVLVSPADGRCEYFHIETKPTLLVSKEAVNSLYGIYKLRRDGRYKVPVVCHYDLQLFIKNLKLYASKIRWFIQSEIGPTTKRPHYHGLLFFSDYEPEYIKESIYKAWTKCDWSVHEHRDSIHLCHTASYCTSYVASCLQLPAFHQYGRFAMFHYCSTRPPIGSLSYSSEEMSKYQNGESIGVVRYNVKSNEYTVNPFLRSMETKSFRRLPNYNLLSSSARDLLLWSYRLFAPCYPFELPECKVCSSRKSVPTYNDYIWRHIRRYSFSQYADNFSSFLEKHPIFRDLCKDAFTSESSLYRVFLASRQYCRAVQLSNKLFVDYCYDTHYYQVEMAKLRQQYLYEEDFCNRRKLSPKFLIYKDLEFVSKYSYAFGLVPDWVDMTLCNYGFSDIDDFTSSVEGYELKRNPDCIKYFNQIHVILHESHKTKANRSYLYQRKVDYLDDTLDSFKRLSNINSIHSLIKN